MNRVPTNAKATKTRTKRAMRRSIIVLFEEVSSRTRRMAELLAMMEEIEFMLKVMWMYGSWEVMVGDVRN